MIIVNINPGETYARVAGLWQYDYGQVLRIQGLSLPPAIEIHFSLQETGGEAVTRVGVTKDGATDVVIPDFIIEGAGAIEDYFAYAFIYPSDENSGQTEHRIEIGVKSRPKPEGYKGSGDDTMGAVMNAINEIAAGKADGLEYKNSILRLMSGEAELARVTISGAPGKDGVDGITPHIGDNGNWYIGETDTGVKAEAPSIDSTLTESGKAADSKITGEKISELKGEIDQLKQAGTGSGSGVTVAQSNSLWAIIQKAAFAEVLTDEELNDFKTAWGITTENIPATGIALDKSTLSFTDSASQTLVATVEPSDTTDRVVWTSNAESVATVANGVVKPVSNGSATITATCGSVLATCSVTVDIAEEEQVTLTSISATYTGGEVAVGTALTALTGITVTGIYSDGSTSEITGYTLSGEILEGSNTITISYGGKTTAVTVTGVAESGGGDVGPLYAFESVENAEIKSRYGNQSGYLTISNGNHIKITTGASSEWFWDVNVSSAVTNGVTGANVTNTWFTIPAGANVKLCPKNISIVNAGNIRAAAGATQSIHDIFKFVNSNEIVAEEFTFTVDSDTNVPCITTSVIASDNKAPVEAEFDFELYVNGVRWI